MGNLDDILKKHAKRHGIERQVEAVGVVEAATEEIAKFIAREDFEVISFRDGVLKIKATSSSAAAYIKEKLKGEFINKQSIKRVLFIN